MKFYIIYKRAYYCCNTISPLGHHYNGFVATLLHILPISGIYGSKEFSSYKFTRSTMII